jgi:hypothetical protein
MWVKHGFHTATGESVTWEAGETLSIELSANSYGEITSSEGLTLAHTDLTNLTGGDISYTVTQEDENNDTDFGFQVIIREDGWAFFSCDNETRQGQ